MIMTVARTKMYVMGLDPYCKYTGEMMHKHNKLIVWDELIVNYPMAWY